MTDYLVDTLRHLDGTEYPGRGDRLDPALVVRAGRRRRRTGRLLVVAGAVVLVVALVLVVPAVARPRPAPPAAPPSSAVQQPRSMGAATVVTVAPDVVALNRPQEATPVDRLEADDLAGLDLVILPLEQPGPGRDGAAVTVSRTASAGAAQDVTWLAGDHPADYGAGLTGLYDAVTVLSADDPPADRVVMAGAVPSWQRAPVAVLVSADGWTTSDGRLQHATEVPTFRVPTSDGRLMYAIALTGAMARQVQEDLPPTVVFLDSDGSTLVPLCDALTVEACGQRWGVPLAQWVQDRAVPDGPTVGASPAPTPCAEFPAVGELPGDVEGWWSSSPADAQGNILRDPAEWPAAPREHPRVALVDTDTGAVISTWDRIACGPDPTFVPTRKPDWPAHSVAVVDMDTGETVDY